MENIGYVHIHIFLCEESHPTADFIFSPGVPVPALEKQELLCLYLECSIVSSRAVSYFEKLFELPSCEKLLS